MEVGIEIRGVEKLVRKLNRISDDKTTNRITAKALRKAAKPLKAASVAMVPVRTGRLKASIITWSRKRKGTTRVFVGIKPKAFAPDEFFYPAPVEFGHMRGDVHVPAQPYLRDAADEQEDTVLRIARNEIARGIELVVKKK